jgi:hypothetical protein
MELLIFSLFLPFFAKSRLKIAYFFPIESLVAYFQLLIKKTGVLSLCKHTVTVVRDFVQVFKKSVTNCSFFGAPRIKKNSPKNRFSHHLAFFVDFLRSFMTFNVGPIF